MLNQMQKKLNIILVATFFFSIPFKGETNKKHSSEHYTTPVAEGEKQQK